MKKFNKIVAVVILLAMLLTLGQTLALAQEVTCDSDVVVQADDWLSKIANKFLGDPLAYPAIVDATNAVAATDSSYATIANADIIEVGWKLCIPAGEAASAMMDESASQAAAMAEGQQVLTVWDVWTRPEEEKMIAEFNAQFETSHPGVTINREAKAFDDMKATAKLALSSPDGPDIVQVNQGWSDMGAMVEGGLLANLTPYAEKYGWVQKISPGIAARNSFTGDGQTFGQGNLYGVPPVAELVGVYYRKDIFAELGLSVPKTYGEFEAVLAATKEAGYTPLVFGNLDAWPAVHLIGELVNNEYDSRNAIDDLIYAWGNGATWDSPEVLAASEKVAEWVEAGYLSDGFAGIGYDDSTALFDNGEGAMMLTGSWMSSTFQAGPYGEQIGFFLIPPATEGSYRMATGGTSLAYAIRADSPNIDLAAEYIDLLMSDEAAKAWAASGTVPVTPVDPAETNQGALFADLITAWNKMNQENKVGQYLDWASPTFYDTLTTGMQELMAGQITPAEFTQKLEADHAAFLAEKNQ